MSADKFMINNIAVRQPDAGMPVDFETTYSDAYRTQTGKLVKGRMYTVQSIGYNATGLTLQETATILQQVADGENYTLHYFSVKDGIWKDGIFYTGKGSLEIGCLDPESGLISSLSFNMIGVNPID